MRAGAVGAVEREQARRHLGEARAAVDARVALRQDLLGHPRYRDDDEARADRERGLERVGEALAQALLHHHAIDHDLDRVLLLLVEPRQVAGELDGLAVDARAQEALLRQLLELASVLALLAANERRVEGESSALGQRQDAVDHLLHGLRPDRLAALGTVRSSDRGVEESQVVVDLGHRAHRRARVARHRLLLDRDRGREALDRVDVGLLDLVQELAGVGRQRLDVAALPFGEQGVEGERRLARPRHPGDDDQTVAGDLEREVLEVVLASAADDDPIHDENYAV